MDESPSMCVYRVVLRMIYSPTRLEEEREEEDETISRALDPQLKVHNAILKLLRLLCVHARVLGTRVREQGVATRVHSRAERAGIFPGEMHVIMIAHVRHDLTAQRAPPPLVGVTLSLKYL